jgi:hypothetical protein
MSNSEQAFCLIGLVLCLGTCLVWALYEIEDWRRRYRRRVELVRDAMSFVETAKTNHK